MINNILKLQANILRQQAEILDALADGSLDTVKVEAPAEAPKAEKKKAEKKAEAPKAEVPKVEAPKAEEKPAPVKVDLVSKFKDLAEKLGTPETKAVMTQMGVGRFAEATPEQQEALLAKLEEMVNEAQ